MPPVPRSLIPAQQSCHRNLLHAVKQATVWLVIQESKEVASMVTTKHSAYFCQQFKKKIHPAQLLSSPQRSEQHRSQCALETSCHWLTSAEAESKICTILRERTWGTYSHFYSPMPDVTVTKGMLLHTPWIRRLSLSWCYGVNNMGQTPPLLHQLRSPFSIFCEHVDISAEVLTSEIN